MPDWRDYAVDVPAPGAVMGEATRVMGRLLRDVMAMNPETFRVVGPDETASNRLSALFEVTDRAWRPGRGALVGPGPVGVDVKELNAPGVMTPGSRAGESLT